MLSYERVNGKGKLNRAVVVTGCQSGNWIMDA